jgi:hypothetical protein
VSVDRAADPTRYESTLCEGADFDGQGHADCTAGLVEQPDGDWVLYADHRAAVAAQKERDAKIAFEQSVKEGSMAEGADEPEFGQLIYAEQVARYIAAAIREGSEDG